MGAATKVIAQDAESVAERGRTATARAAAAARHSGARQAMGLAQRRSAGIKKKKPKRRAKGTKSQQQRQDGKLMTGMRQWGLWRFPHRSQ
jgi:hypothetical protein